MKNYIFLILTTIFSISYTQSQVTVCLGNDATVCQGTQVIIDPNCSAGGGGSPIGGIVLNNPTVINLTDDVWSGVVPIGFNFTFYGASYNQCVLGSNGILTFDLSNANTGCSYSLTAVPPIPTSGTPDMLNSIMPFYQDINPGLANSGDIQYQTIGTAPNRMFVALWREIGAFSCGTTQCNYAAIILYESTNIIECHVGKKEVCAGWNGGLAIQGVQNSTGAFATATPGRNNTQWTCLNDGKRFSATSATNYSVATIPYIHVQGQGSTLAWGNTLGQTLTGNANGTLTINQVPPGTTGYFKTGTSCGIGMGGVTDTTWITRVNASVTATSTPDMCSSGIGSVTANPGAASPPPYQFSWPLLGSSAQTVNNVNGGTYTVSMIDGNGCTANATVVVANTPATFTGTSTLVSCSYGTNGTATAVMTPMLGTVSYLWSDPAGQTTQTATNLAPGTYTCQVSSNISPACQGIVTVTVNAIPTMINTIQNQVDVTCNSSNDGIAVISSSQGTAPYQYQWSGSLSTSNTANDLFVGNHQVIISDANNCLDTLQFTLNEPPALQITSVTNDTTICPENSIILNVSGSGGSSPYTFTWKENGNQIGTGTSITVDPSNTNTQYCVELSETCGSPTTDTCLVINFPTPIVPSYAPVVSKICIPATFELNNTSNNQNEIATTQIVWSNGLVSNELGADSLSVTFPIPGQYSMNITTTSIYNCVYTNQITNIIEAKDLPVADFSFSSNPATFFETQITIQDQSTKDVVNWEWSITGANPPSSFDQDPTVIWPEGVEGTYPVTLIVTSDLGCKDTISYDMSIIADVIFYAPNTFTPDNDEFNQSWSFHVAGIDEQNFELYIYNKWGELIWETHDPKAKWDGTYGGKPLQTGTYVWKARVKQLNNDGKRTFQGHINILR